MCHIQHRCADTRPGESRWYELIRDERKRGFASDTFIPEIAEMINHQNTSYEVRLLGLSLWRTTKERHVRNNIRRTGEKKNHGRNVTPFTTGERRRKRKNSAALTSSLFWDVMRRTMIVTDIQDYQSVPKRWKATINLRCVTPQKSKDFIYTALEAWNHSLNHKVRHPRCVYN